MDKDLVLRQLAEEGEAKRLFRKLVEGNTERPQLLAIIGEQPETALAALAKGEVSTGLTVRGTANVLDDVLGTIADPTKARELLEDYFAQEQVIELITAHGDRDSVVEQIASLEDVISAVLRDMQVDAPPLRRRGNLVPLPAEGRLPRRPDAKAEPLPTDLPRSDADAVSEEALEDGLEAENEDGRELLDEAESTAEVNGELEAEARAFPPSAFFALLAWASKLKERDDFERFLEFSLAGWSIRDHLLIHAWNESGQPSNVHRVDASRLDEVGLDVEEGYARLDELLSSEDELPRLDRDALEDARLELSERKRRNETLPLVAQAAEDAQSSLVEASKNAF